MADSISIAASITGIITAAVKITTVLSDLHDAPDHIADLSAEVNNIRIVFKAFQRLIEKPLSLPSRRAAMIQLEDVVVIVTEIVLVFSELETIVTPLATRQRSKLRALTWVWQRSTTTRLVNQLQRHKSSLTVVLSIIACDSDIEAADAAAALQRNIEEQVEKSTDISERLERLQLSIDGQLHEPEAMLSKDDDTSGAKLHPDYQATLDEILENSTVYKRALHRSSNAGSSSSVVSKSWSIISGISMTQISVLAVLNLPLYDNEIERFRHLADGDGYDSRGANVKTNQEIEVVSDVQQTDRPVTLAASINGRCNSVSSRTSLGEIQGAIRRLNKEFAAMQRNPPEHFTCGPIGGDMFEWSASIMGLPGTPYAGGTFLVAIHIPTRYPLKTPRVNFTTRVYHPNIDSNGAIPSDVLVESWNPSMTIEKVLSNLVTFLSEPLRYSGNVPDTRCLVSEIGHIYWTNRELFILTARDWTRKYAI